MAVKQLDAAAVNESFVVDGRSNFNVLFGETQSHEIFALPSDEKFTVYSLGDGEDALSDDGLLLKNYELLSGGRGDDTYTVNFAQTKVLEKSNEGTDTIKADVEDYKLLPNVENLVLLNLLLDLTPSLKGSGNELKNQITGNNRANILDGRGGIDHIYGGSGHDRLIGGAGDDWLYGEDGNDWAVDAGKRSDFKVSNSGNHRTAVDRSGAEGSDSLFTIERLKFSDVSLSFDQGGEIIAKIIGAVFGKPYLTGELIGIGISLFDSLNSSTKVALTHSATFEAQAVMQADDVQLMQQIANIALETGLYVQLAGSRSLAAKSYALVYGTATETTARYSRPACRTTFAGIVRLKLCAAISVRQSTGLLLVRATTGGLYAVWYETQQSQLSLPATTHPPALPAGGKGASRPLPSGRRPESPWPTTPW